VEIKINEKLLRQLDQIPVLLRQGPLDRCLKAFGQPIKERAKTLAPSSRESGSRLKWSRRFKDNQAFQNDSGKEMGVKVLKSGIGVIVGATHPKGNKQQFGSPRKKGDSYQRNFWGKAGQQVQKTSKRGRVFVVVRKTKAKTATFPVKDRPVARAYDQQKASAESAFLAQLNKEIKGLNLG
jgi:hypothetical protein